MPNRILHESICTSVSIAALSRDAEVLQYRLTVKADDYGRFHADPLIVLGACFPHEIGKTTAEQIASWTRELAAQDTIRLYEVDGKHFLFFPKWDRSQRTRANKSKFPDPPAEIANPPSSDSKRGHVTSNVAGIRESVDEDESRDSIGRAAKPRLPLHPPDAAWDAFVDSTGVSASELSISRRKALNGMLANLRRCWSGPPEELPGEIAARADELRRRWPDIPVTPEFLTKRWAELGQPFARGPTSTADQMVASLNGTRGGDGHAGAGGEGPGGLPRGVLPPA
jgi:hypothetical protein